MHSSPHTHILLHALASVRYVRELNSKKHSILEKRSSLLPGKSGLKVEHAPSAHNQEVRHQPQSALIGPEITNLDVRTCAVVVLRSSLVKRSMCEFERWGKSAMLHSRVDKDTRVYVIDQFMHVHVKEVPARGANAAK